MPLSLATHHRVALPAAAATSGIALFDAMTHGFAGDYSVFSDDSGATAFQLAGSIVHGVTYAALALVLVRESARLRAAGRAASAFRWILLASLGVLALAFLVLYPVELAADARGTFDAYGALVGPAFLLMFVAGFGLGVSLLRRPEMAYGARLLAGVVPVIGLTALLAWAAPDFAHPAYAETLVHFGVALLGARTATTTVRATAGQEAMRAS